MSYLAYDNRTVSARELGSKRVANAISTGRVLIMSGEGEVGRTVEYHGTRTTRAIRARVARERCGGDRWCYVYVRMHDDVYAMLDVYTGDQSCEREIPSNLISE